MILTRIDNRSDGIFGHLTDAKSGHTWSTLEHAYPGESADWISKIPAGHYVCVRGIHRLHHMNHDFETFEITEIPGHSKILFHPGNYDKDSEGCVLLGESTADYKGGRMLQHSQEAFSIFMESLHGIDTFVLTIW